MADIQKITPLPYTTPIVGQNGVLTQQAQAFFEVLYNRALAIGVGSPEDVVEAQKGAEYMDETGTTGSIKWIKKFDAIGGDARKGWILQ